MEAAAMTALLGKQKAAHLRDGAPSAAQRIERIVCTRCFLPAQSGQRMPTGVVVMQSGQIALPQFEHETPVSRDGWR